MHCLSHSHKPLCRLSIWEACVSVCVSFEWVILGCLATMLPLRQRPITSLLSFIHSQHFFFSFEGIQSGITEGFSSAEQWDPAEHCTDWLSMSSTMKGGCGAVSLWISSLFSKVLGSFSLSSSEFELNKEPLLLWAWKAYWITAWAILGNANKLYFTKWINQQQANTTLLFLCVWTVLWKYNTLSIFTLPRTFR